MLKQSVCVVGAGYWGKNHIRTLHELGSLGGIVEQNEDLLDQITNQYPDAKTYLNIGEALDNKEFVGFTVATPAETHHDIAVQIIKSGKHVLVEKPLCLNIKDAENMVNLAKQYKVNLMVGHVMLFHPAIMKIKELISKGIIGKLQYIYSNRLNLGQVRTQENVFWSFAPHDISIFQYFTNIFPEEIKANGSSFLQKGIHDSTLTQLKYPNGVEGHIFVSWLHPFKEHRLVVIGSDAMITFEDSAKGKPLKLYSKKFNMSSGLPEKIDGPMKKIKYEEKMPLSEELKYFVEHLDGAVLQIANGQHALEVNKVLVEASKQLENHE
jgi:UDP-2-acetamido-3-amino-2,3-dideoxy-glucuronate N-acetyltransferase